MAISFAYVSVKCDGGGIGTSAASTATSEASPRETPPLRCKSTHEWEQEDAEWLHYLPCLPEADFGFASDWDYYPMQEHFHRETPAQMNFTSHQNYPIPATLACESLEPTHMTTHRDYYVAQPEHKVADIKASGDHIHLAVSPPTLQSLRESDINDICMDVPLENSGALHETWPAWAFASTCPVAQKMAPRPAGMRQVPMKIQLRGAWDDTLPVGMTSAASDVHTVFDSSTPHV